MGIAIECRRLDKLEEAITRSDNIHGTLSYCINVSHSFVNRREYRREVRCGGFSLLSPSFGYSYKCLLVLDILYLAMAFM